MSLRTFGPFRFDPATGELWRSGLRVKLQPLLARLLVEFISRPNQLIERASLARALWPAGTFVDYENSLNNAVARLRRTIGAHRIEVLPKRGYRFRARMRATPTRTDPQVERDCRLGRHFWNRSTAASLERALGHFHDAVSHYPEHASAWAGLAETYLLLGDDVIGGMPPSDALDRAGSAARRALECLPDCADALAVSGMVAWRRDWRWKEAETLFRAAIAADPAASRPRVYYAWLLHAAGRVVHADSQIGRALELDPVSSFVSTNAGLMLYFSRRHADAITHLRDTVVLDEHYPLAYLALGLAHSARGEFEPAAASLGRAVSLSGGRSQHYRAVLGYTTAAATTDLSGLRAYDRALVHLGREEIGPCIDCLERARGEQSSHLAYLGVDPLFDRLRGEKRFRQLTRSIGLI